MSSFTPKLIKIYSRYYLIGVFLRFSFPQEKGKLIWPSYFNELSAHSKLPSINTQSLYERFKKSSDPFEIGDGCVC